MSDIYVLGAGSIGCLFSYYLRKHNNNIILITKNDSKNDSNNQKKNNFEKPLSVELKFKSSEGEPIINDVISCIVKTPREIEENNEKIKVLLVTTKSPDTLEAIKTVEHLLDSESIIILMQNGVLGTYALLTEYFLIKYKQIQTSNQKPPFLLPRILVGTTSNGAYRVAPFKIVHAGKGTSFIGEPNSYYTQIIQDQLKDLSPSITLQTIHAQFSPLTELSVTVYTQAQDYSRHLLPLLQTKLVVNACLNPLTALFECLNGWIVDIIDNETQTLKNIKPNDHPCHVMIREICQEAAWVLVEEDQEKEEELNNDNDDDDDNEDHSPNLELPISLDHLSPKARSQAIQWEKEVIEVARKTCLNRNSMLQDIEAKRAQTEIDYLNGYLVREATRKYEHILQDHFIFETPHQPILKVNEMLVRLIKMKSWIRSQN